MKETLTLKQADELDSKFKIFEGADALGKALNEQMTKGGFLYTQVDTEDSPMYLEGIHIVNRTGVYAVLDVHEKLTCNVCGKEYTDRPSIKEAKRLRERWETICRVDGVKATGICACPVMECPGQVVLSEF